MEKSRAIELLEHLAWDRDIERNPYGDALNMAIEALKAQLSSEDATKDAISKTETVEHLRRMLEATVPNTDYDEGYIDGIEFGISTVSTMPTVKPEPCGDKSYALWKESYEELKRRMDELTSCSDTISRQAAVDAAKDWYEGLICGSVNGLIKKLKALPTVQPERKKGEWIEISSINHTYKCSECGRLLVNITDGRNSVSKHYPYCHCGADMKGEQNEVRTP